MKLPGKKWWQDVSDSRDSCICKGVIQQQKSGIQIERDIDF